jgi:hypothetical protein
MRSAARTVASTIGVYMSLAGLEHGVDEILQGSVPPPGLMFESSWRSGLDAALNPPPPPPCRQALPPLMGMIAVPSAASGSPSAWRSSPLSVG